MSYTDEPFSSFLVRSMAAAKLTNQQVADRFGIKSQAVSQWKSGRNMPKSSIIDEVRRYLSDAAASAPSASHMAAPKKSQLDGTYGMVSIPELDVRAAAGAGLVAEELGESVKQWMIPLIDLLGLSDTPRALRIITVEGDSMEPDYRPGEKILIDTSLQEYTHDGVYVLDFGFGLVVKHLQLVLDSDPARLLVISTNTTYQPQEIALDRAEIKGKVAAKWQRR